MDALSNWSSDPPVFSPDSEELLGLERFATLDEFIECSEKFPVSFPIQTGRCKELRKQKVPVDDAILLRNVNSAYPVLHECALPLFVDFIRHKRKFGSAKEKKLYKDMTLLELVDRLLKKRAVIFVGSQDAYLLLNGETQIGGWESVGTDKEKGPLKLDKCLSYDEIKLSALLSVSSYTYFLNGGKRNNVGIVATDRTKVQEEGIIIGLIGTRMKKRKYMEYQEIIIEEDQNSKANGYGENETSTMASLFSDFYGKRNWIYDDFVITGESRKTELYAEFRSGVYFDNVTFCKRIAISFDTLLFEANHRAKREGVGAYVHVVGIGLGVWMCSPHQSQLFLNTCAKRIEALGKYLHNIHCIYFAWFPTGFKCGPYADGAIIPIENHPTSGVRVFMGQRDPHESLKGGPFEDKLLVVSYAWDGNALPGNEYWGDGLASSSDPAAACSTQVAEIHNPHINRNVSAGNLRIAARGEIYPFRDYIEQNKTWNLNDMLKNFSFCDNKEEN